MHHFDPALAKGSAAGKPPLGGCRTPPGPPELGRMGTPADSCHLPVPCPVLAAVGLGPCPSEAVLEAEQPTCLQPSPGTGRSSLAPAGHSIHRCRDARIPCPWHRQRQPSALQQPPACTGAAPSSPTPLCQLSARRGAGTPPVMPAGSIGELQHQAGCQKGWRHAGGPAAVGSTQGHASLCVGMSRDKFQRCTVQNPL